MSRPFLPDVEQVNINHRASRQEAISRCFYAMFKEGKICHWFFSVLTCGVYPYKMYKKAKQATAQAIAARKLFFFNDLCSNIEEIRAQEKPADPRQSLNAIFMQVQSKKGEKGREGLEFKAIYSPTELLLFITNPVRERKKIRLYRVKSNCTDYLKMWYALKKKALVNQYRQIESINFCNKILREEFCLTPEEIHGRLARTTCFLKSPCSLTQFRELSRAFQEVVIAYQDFEGLSTTNPELFSLIGILGKTSEKDIKILQTYLTGHSLPRALPIENRRQLIQLGNQQDTLYHMSEEELFNSCALILNQYQWDFLLSIQEVSQVTLNLLDWAFETSPEEIKPPPSFLERIYPGTRKKVEGEQENFPLLNEKIKEDRSLCHMTVHFACEFNREWPSIHLYYKEHLLSKIAPIESVSIEHLIYVYHELRKLTTEDNVLLALLQETISQVGKTSFQAAIEEGVLKVLGEKSEYFLPIFTSSDITMIKRGEKQIEIRYAFEQIILKKGEVQPPFAREKQMIITQPLQHDQGHWICLEPKVQIIPKQKVA